MAETTKVIIYIKDVSKPIVFTCTQTKEYILKLFDAMWHEDKLETISFDNGDVFVCRKSDIRAITITTEKPNQDD